MTDVLVPMLTELLQLVLVVLIGFVIALVKKQLGVTKMKQLSAEFANKQEIVNTVVLFVQQVYAASDGAKKYEIALTTATNWLKEKNITMSTGELQSLIESNVLLLKKEFVDDWEGKPESLNE